MIRTVDVQCPYCFQVVSILVEEAISGVAVYVEDCEVCCRPWQVTVMPPDSGGHVAIEKT